MGRIIGLMNIWMVPAFFVFVAGWLVGGGYLLRKSLLKRTGTTRRPPKLGSCVLSVFLAGSAGGFAAVVILFFFYVLAVFMQMKLFFAILGAILSLISMMAVSLMVLWARYDVSFKDTVKLGGPAIGGVLGIAFLLAILVGVPSYLVGKTTKSRDKSVTNLLRIHNAMHIYERAIGKPAETLEVMVGKNYLVDREIQSPAFPDKAVGYFYMPTSVLVKKDSPSLRKIIVCDFAGGEIGSGRAALMVNRDCEWYDEDDFQDLLAEEINAEFAAALRAAEGS